MIFDRRGISSIDQPVLRHISPSPICIAAFVLKLDPPGPQWRFDCLLDKGMQFGAQFAQLITYAYERSGFTSLLERFADHCAEMLPLIVNTIILERKMALARVAICRELVRERLQLRRIPLSKDREHTRHTFRLGLVYFEHSATRNRALNQTGVCNSIRCEISSVGRCTGDFCLAINTLARGS
jgi:hypothetical protein